jgi:hypothetical protein
MSDLVTYRLEDAVATVTMDDGTAVRQAAMAAMREAIDRELTLDAYKASAANRTAVVLPGGD